MIETAPKGLIGRWVTVAALIAIAAYSALVLTTISLALESERRASHSQLIVAEIRLLLEEMVDAETGARRFLATGDEKFLASYREAQGIVPRDLQGLRERVAADSAQQARLNQIDGLVKAQFEIIAVDLQAYRQPQAKVEIDETAMDRFRLAERAFEQEEKKQFLERTKTLLDDYELLAEISLLFSLLTAAAVIIGVEKHRKNEARALAAAAAERLQADEDAARLKKTENDLQQPTR